MMQLAWAAATPRNEYIILAVALHNQQSSAVMRTPKAVAWLHP